jgi:16S rRNA (cytosine1402-N4)-methyltransferase
MVLTNRKHVPVLLEQILSYLEPQPGETYLDLTAGYGGHAKAILGRTLKAPAVLVDRDQKAADYLKEQFKGSDVSIRQQDFLSTSRQLVSEGKQFDLILADLGVSWPQLEDGSRGFAIRRNGPLDMRMDRRQGLTAARIVNQWSQKQIEQVLRRYGEEPKAGAIARRIVEVRPVTSTSELATLVSQVWPGRSKIHPATRVFQALRIAVNDELKQLEQSLTLWLQLLTPGGRLVVISFHSLEDRIVKQLFADQTRPGYDTDFKLLTKKPVTASRAEIVSNPRARSAKLRAVAKIKTKIERKKELYADSG